MGETIRGGYYRGVDGKYRNANGEEVQGGEGEKWAAERTKDQLRAAEKELGRPAREIHTEAEQRDERQMAMAEAAATATDPSPLGPAVMPAGPQTTEAVRKSAEKPGVPGGRTERKK